MKPPGDHWIDMPDGRGYLLHVPPGRADEPRPAVLLLHGTGGTAQWAKDESRIGPFADRHGLVGVFPQGLPPDPTSPPAFLANPPAWHAGTMIAGHKPDDISYFAALFADVKTQAPIDPRRIYAAGFSNGAAMCFELAVHFSDVLAAIAPVAGYCRAKTPPKRPVPTLYIVGSDDAMTPPAGGMVTSPWTGETLQRPPAFKELDHWAGFIGCTTPRQLVSDENGVRTERYPGPVDFTVITVTGLGHHWPGGRGQLKRKLAGKPSDRLDGNESVWEFFQRQRRQ